MRRDIDIIKGQSFTFNGVLRDENGTPRDLTSATLVWRVGGRFFTRSLFELTEGNGITVTDATNGKWQVTLRPTDTAEEDSGRFRHQGEATIGSAVYGFTSGRVTLRQDLRSPS